MDNSKFAEMIVGGRLRQHADRIVEKSIAAVLPDSAVERALEGVCFPGNVILVAVGKAACGSWEARKPYQRRYRDHQVRSQPGSHRKSEDAGGGTSCAG